MVKGDSNLHGEKKVKCVHDIWECLKVYCTYVYMLQLSCDSQFLAIITPVCMHDLIIDFLCTVPQMAFLQMELRRRSFTPFILHWLPPTIFLQHLEYAVPLDASSSTLSSGRKS